MVDLALRHKIERARTHWISLLGLEGIAWTGAVLIAAALLCFHIDWNWALTAHQRIACWAGGGLLLAACAAWFVALPCLRPRSDESVAARVERRFPSLGERLLSTVELSRIANPAARGFSAPMVTALSEETSTAAAGLD